MMQVGTEILLARMKECPEEFMRSSKWDKLLGEARNCLPKNDIEALEEGLRQINVDWFNEAVLKTLAGEPLEAQTQYHPGTMTYKSRERYATGWTDPRTSENLAMQAEQQRHMMRNAAQSSALQGLAASALQGLGAQGSSSYLSGLSK